MIIKEKDDSISWSTITDILHKAYREHKEANILFGATSQSVEQTIYRAQPNNALDYVTFVAFSDDKPVGTISASIYYSDGRWYHGEKYCWFCMFGVLPEYRGGIGTRLLESVENYAKNNGCNSVVLATAGKVAKLVSFYESHGYQKVAFESYLGTNFYATVFAKNLSLL